jgi:hypothetical protein
MPPDMEIHSHLSKQKALEQVMEVLNKNDTCKCLKYNGKKLISCMDYASEEEVRLTFSNMSYQARMHYLLAMDLMEYKRFLDAFENESQWKESLNNLPAQERALLPQTILEQLIMIRDTWISCAPRKVGVYASGTKDAKAQDIAAWRNKTFDRYEYMREGNTELRKWLNERFMEQKINMFGILKQQSTKGKTP